MINLDSQHRRKNSSTKCPRVAFTVYNNIPSENGSSGGAKAAVIGTTKEQGTTCRASRNLLKLTRSTT
jgi:hypothetical protein